MKEYRFRPSQIDNEDEDDLIDGGKQHRVSKRTKQWIYFVIAWLGITLVFWLIFTYAGETKVYLPFHAQLLSAVFISTEALIIAPLLFSKTRKKRSKGIVVTKYLVIWFCIAATMSLVMYQAIEFPVRELCWNSAICSAVFTYFILAYKGRHQIEERLLKKNRHTWLCRGLAALGIWLGAVVLTSILFALQMLLMRETGSYISVIVLSLVIACAGTIMMYGMVLLNRFDKWLSRRFDEKLENEDGIYIYRPEAPKEVHRPNNILDVLFEQEEAVEEIISFVPLNAIERTPLPANSQITGDQCYTIIGEPLGTGGSSIVYKAQSTEQIETENGYKSQTRTWIIKEFYPAELTEVILRTSEGTLTIREDFISEFIELRQHFIDGFKNHISLQEKFPNQMIHVRTHFTANGTEYIVMDAAKGTTLDKLPPSKSLHEITKLTLSLCNALVPFHANGLLYLDIKPQNLYKYHDEDRIVLFDFDTVQSVEAIQGSRTKPPSTKGWAAWELTSGDHASISQSTDLYSVGQVMFWLLMGRKCESERDGQRDFRKRCELCYGLSDTVEALLEKIFKFTLSATPTMRYRSVERLIADLETLSKYTEPGYGDLQVSIAESTDRIIQHQEKQTAEVLGRIQEYSIVGRPKLSKKRKLLRFLMCLGVAACILVIEFFLISYAVQYAISQGIGI